MRNLILIFPLLLLNTVAFSQCAMCKAAVESTEDTDGFNTGIEYLMMFPYIIFGVAIGLFVYFINNKKVES